MSNYKKKKITNKTSTMSNPLTKVRTGYNEARDSLSWRSCALGKTFVDRLCEELYEWGKLDTSISFLDFYHSWGIPKRTFHDYMKKHSDLKFIHELVKEIIGVRLQKLAMYRKNECNEKTIHRILHLYHPDWKEVHDSEVDLKKELKQGDTKQKPTNITVLMEKY